MNKIIVICLFASLSLGQSKFTPSHEQTLELENAQLRAKLAQQQAAQAQNNFQIQVQLLKATCKAVATKNNWPKDIDCNVDTLVFAEPKAEVKKEEKK